MDENMFDLGLDVATISAELPDPVITLSGADSYTVQGTADYPLLALSVYGKSVQNGTPTPDAPIDIVNVGDDGNVEIISGFSVADNVMLELGGVDGNGLNTENSTRIRSKNYIAVKPNTRYTITAKHNTSKGNLKIHLSFYSTNDYSTNRIGLADWRNGNSYDFITPSNANYVRILFGVDGSTANVALSLDDVYNVCVFEDVVATITSGLPLCSIDSVKDELIYNADGTGKIIKRTAKIVFDGSNDEAWQNSEGNAPFQITISDGSLWESRLGLPKLYCSKYQRVPQGATWGSYDYMVSANASGTSLAIRDISVTTLEEFKAKLNAVPMAVVYVLATPKEIELSSDEMAELQKLQSYEGTTSIYNDEQAEMLAKMLRREFDMKYIEWLKESQTWTCPKAGKWKVICVGGGASGGMYEEATSSGATEKTLTPTTAGGTTSFGSIIAADGAPSTSDYTAHGYSATRIAVSGYGGYTGTSYGGVPMVGGSSSSAEFGTGGGSGNAAVMAFANPTAAVGYGAGGGAGQRYKGNFDVSPIPGRAGSIESTIVDLEEGQAIMCTVGKGGQTTDATLMGSGADGVIVVQYLGY